MNSHEEYHKRKSSEVNKVNEDPTRTYKSKTPVPKNLAKHVLKRNHQKRGIKKSSTPRKDQLKIPKHNSNDFKELSGEFVKRTKNRGSRSVDLFNNIQDPKKTNLNKSILTSNLPKVKIPKKLEKLDHRQTPTNLHKPSEKPRKKSSSPSALRPKDQKHSKQLINIQNLLNSFGKKKKSTKLKSKKLQSGTFTPIPNTTKQKKTLNLNLDSENSIEQLQPNIKLDSWLNSHSKVSNSEIFSDLHPNHIVDESEVIAKNASFIHTDKLKESLHNDLKTEMLNNKLFKSVDSFDKSPEFIEYECDLETYPVTLGKIQENRCTVQRQDTLEIFPKKQFFSLFQTNLSVPPQPKRELVLVLDLQSQISINSQSTPNTLQEFQVFSTKSSHFTLKTQTWQCSLLPSVRSNTQTLIEQLSEELTNNINHLFILEQLKSLEKLANVVFFAMVPDELQQALKSFTDSKYSAIFDFLRPSIETRVSKFLSRLNPESTTKFLQMSQKKKEIIKELFSDLPSLQTLLASQSNSESSPTLSYQELEHANPENYSSNSLSSSSEVPLVDFCLKPIDCKPDFNFAVNTQMLLTYSKNVLMSLNPDLLLKGLETPLSKDPLAELDKIQDLQIGTFIDQAIRDYEKLFDYQKAFEIDLIYDSNSHKSDDQLKIEKIFKTLALDSINFLLQQFKPFGFKGKPLPWQMVKQFDGKIESFEDVFNKVLQDLVGFCECGIGKWGDVYVGIDEKVVRARVTERQIGKVLQIEIVEEEGKWVDYEFEEVQVKIDLADVVLYELVLEVINISN